MEAESVCLRRPRMLLLCARTPTKGLSSCQVYGSLSVILGSGTDRHLGSGERGEVKPGTLTESKYVALELYKQ